MKNLTSENTYDLLSQLAKREGIEPGRVIEIIASSFKEAYAKDHSEMVRNNVEFSFDPVKKEFLAYRVYKVLEQGELITDPEQQIAGDDKRLTEDVKISEQGALLPIDIKNLPKFVAYNVRKNIQRLIQEMRKEKQYQNFLPLKGEIVSGHIQSIQDSFCIINLGKGLGYWDKKEWNFEDRNYLGKNLRFLLLDVQEKSDLKQLVLSRRGESFLRKLLEAEVPEIREGIVQIEKIIRLPGLMSKVIVSSDNPRIDPVGACIGKQGSRIKSVLKEVGRERIDLAGWNEDKLRFLFSLLSPVEIISLVEESENNWVVIVPEHRMSLALYGGGKMIQKIEEYLELTLHIKSFESLEQENNVIVWNGNINFDEYEVKKNLFSSKQKQIEVTR